MVLRSFRGRGRGRSMSSSMFTHSPEPTNSAQEHTPPTPIAPTESAPSPPLPPYLTQIPVAQLQAESIPSPRPRTYISGPSSSTPLPMSSHSSTSPIASDASQPTCSGHSNVVKRKVRGETRGLGTHDWVQLHGRIPIVMDPALGRPVDSDAAIRLTSECGVLVRQEAPLRAKKWSDIKIDEKIPIMKRLLDKFEFNLANEAIVDYLNRTMGKLYRDYRHRLASHFLSFKDPEEALQNRPSKVTRQEDWEWLCSHFLSEYFTGLPEGQVQGPVQLFHDTHFSKKSAWINEVADSRYEEMERIICEETVEGSQPPTELEITQRVLGTRSGYIKRMGYGPKSAASSRSSNNRQTDPVVMQEVQSLRSEVDQLRHLNEGMRSELEEYKEMMRQVMAAMRSSDGCQSQQPPFPGPPPPPPPSAAYMITKFWKWKKDSAEESGAKENEAVKKKQPESSAEANEAVKKMKLEKDSDAPNAEEHGGNEDADGILDGHED